MRVNEIFYSIQGEGYHAGTPAIFVRFSGCNLKCSFCDTKHTSYKDMSEDDIAKIVSKYPASLVIITGGEPSLQLTHTLIEKIHKYGKFVAVETNGTHKLPYNVDWITISPKQPFVGDAGKVVLDKADEVKVVFDVDNPIPEPSFGISARYYYVQPCDTGSQSKNQENINFCINFVKNNPLWKISLQTQKILNVQ